MGNMPQEIPYAIRIQGLKKQYRLGQIGGGTLKGDLASWWAKKRGKEDPNSKIGASPRLCGETFLALNGIDLTISQGEAIGIIGRNGAGKSTLLKLLSRVTAPTEGDIDIYGRISSMLEVGTGFNGELTGRENVYMNGAILGMTKAEIDAKMEDIITFSEVRDFIDTPVKRYSSGMYVKLAFAVAAHLDSEIMIMDEVLAVGDMAFQQKCLSKMKENVSRDGRTVLYVSHNMETIRQLCERCVVMDEGKIIFDGDVETAIEYYMGKDEVLQAERTYEWKDHLKKANTALQLLSSRLDRTDCQYDIGEACTVTLTCRAAKDLSGIYFRYQFIAKDGQHIGTAFTAAPAAFSAGQDTEVTLTFPTHELSAGQYNVEIWFYQETNGNAVYLNTVKNGFCFEIKRSRWIGNQYGWGKLWGSIRLADIECEVKPHEP